MQHAKLALGLVLCLLPGCMVIDERQFVTVYHTEVKSYQQTTSTVGKDAPQKPVVQVPQVEKEQVVVQTGCMPFIVPQREALPVTPDFSIVQPPDLEEAIANYIKELRTLIRRERSTFDAAHRDHLSDCQVKFYASPK